MAVKVFAVLKNSVCAKNGVRPGDMLLSINGNDINDVLDYRFYADDEKMKVVFSSVDGRTRTVWIKNAKGYDKLGLAFETYLMDKHRRCKNSCIFCFIDQLPDGLRKSLYFKDDDARLSFLFGNYITLTNLTDEDADRIIKMHISPINASVHTMNPELRVKMMKNPKAGESLKYLKKFSDAGIMLNAQLVLCHGINDGEELQYSLEKLSELDSLKSVAAVPVGLTKFRDGLYPLESFNENTASQVIDIIDRFNEKLGKQGRDKIAFPSDEFYQLAHREIPDYSYYCDFPQLDNGVGMIACMQKEFDDSLSERTADDRERSFSVATGVSAYPLMKRLADEFCKKYSSSNIKVFEIKNRFFGETVTVAGLITGNDLICSLKEQGFSDKYLLLPSVMMKNREELVFLDDVSIYDVEKELCTKVIIAPCEANELLEIFCNL